MVLSVDALLSYSLNRALNELNRALIEP
jgi:hypothetical protein